MQDLIKDVVYDGVLMEGPNNGTKVLVKYLGHNHIRKYIGSYLVLEEVDFGFDPDPDDEFIWREGEIVHLRDGFYEFTEHNPTLENK